MGKLLRVLVIFMFVLSAGALTLGWLLFAKRELLKGRTQKLEGTLIEIGGFVETVPGTIDKPEDPSRDTSPCEAEILETPERSDFWETYKYNLESQEPEGMIELDENLLMTYYKRDPITGKVLKDGRGFRVTEGEGTMYDLLEDMKEKVTLQYDLLNETRTQLTTLRREQINTIEDLNTQKGILREKLVKIEELLAKIAALEQEIRELKAKIVELEAEIASLKEKITELERQIGLLEEQIVEKDAEIARLENRIKILTQPPEEKDEDSPSNSIDDPSGRGLRLAVTGELKPGKKGVIADVNMRWNFVAVHLTDDVLAELMGPDHDLPLPAGTELLVERGRGRKKEFTTKITLRTVDVKQKIGIFNILADWMQSAPRKGDTVFH